MATALVAPVRTDAQQVFVVLLDIRGYSKLSPRAQLAFFEQVLPRIAEPLTSAVSSSVLDANTWGDAVVAVFTSAIAAVTFCTNVRRIFRSETWDLEEFNDLRPRIALHNTLLHSGTDPIRSIQKGHYYGSGIVKPARLEPVVESGYVWVTEEAYSVLREAIDRHEIRGHVLKSLGRRELAKGAGAIEVYCLLEENEREPQLAPQVATLPHDADNALITSRELARISSALAVNQYVENFHLFASQCRTLLDLDRVFASYHIECLLSLRLLSRPEPANGNVSFDADVLLLSAGKLAPFQSATSEAHRRVLPDKYLRKTGKTFVEPSTGDGLAPYVLWANSKGDLGVGAAEDVNGTSDIVYHKRDANVVGSYAQRAVPGMYKHPKAGVGVIPYGSILCAPLGVLQKGLSKPDAAPPVEWIGVLNITATHASKFTTQDCAWAELMAGLLGALYQSYRSRRKELKQVGALAQPPRKPVGRKGKQPAKLRTTQRKKGRRT
jgi:class 3 adenylate cyclase